MAIDQSRTQWNPAKKNAAGKVIQKGYLSQYGKPEKRITGTVALKQAASGVAAGGQRSYVKGRAGATAKPTAARKTTGGPRSTFTADQTKIIKNKVDELRAKSDSADATRQTGEANAAGKKKQAATYGMTQRDQGAMRFTKPSKPGTKPAPPAPTGKPRSKTATENAVEASKRGDFDTYGSPYAPAGALSPSQRSLRAVNSQLQQAKANAAKAAAYSKRKLEREQAAAKSAKDRAKAKADYDAREKRNMEEVRRLQRELDKLRK